MLFEKIKPGRMFFLAVDGVAPRAKMNQQRGRRFRSAQEAAEEVQKLRSEGKDIPKEIFDSNCITPGTEFMDKLSVALKYFIQRKVSTDRLWQNIQIIYSGPDVPGEGEHKIMEYIRLSKAQESYDANTRHCLYGLDADLILLGLLSHDPHFALLREEVTFGRHKNNSQRFFLLHISLLREYIAQEFKTLGDFDLERIIDDFVFFSTFVGDDFLPNLPGVEITHNAFEYIFLAYQTILPAIGYINDHGDLDLSKVSILLQELHSLEIQLFNSQKEEYANFVLKNAELEIYHHIRPFIVSSDIEFVVDSHPFVYRLARKFNLAVTKIDDGKLCLLKAFNDDSDTSDSEAGEAIIRALEKFDGAESAEETHLRSHRDWKSEYYKNKLGIDFNSEDQMRKICMHYTHGLQWIMKYYYEGVASWNWYYPYHYAPKITDLVHLEEFKTEFELGEPFLPFEQLMAVQSSRSSALLPDSLAHLMFTDLREFYPKEFKLDLNGKKNSWEAVVLIPFIDQGKLIESVRSREHTLTAEERRRNKLGCNYQFKYDLNYTQLYPETFSFKEFESHCVMTEYKLPVLGDKDLIKGVLDKATFGVHTVPGFPTFENRHFFPIVGKFGINLFGNESRGNSLVVFLSDSVPINQVVEKDVIYVEWPFTSLAKVDYAIEAEQKHTKTQSIALSVTEQGNFNNLSDSLQERYLKCKGIKMEIQYIVYVFPFLGMQRDKDGNLVRLFSDCSVPVPDKIVMVDIHNPDPRFEEVTALPLAERFPPQSKVVYTGSPYYGAFATVLAVKNDKLDLELRVPIELPSVKRQVEHYFPLFDVSKTLKISKLLLSKITSSFRVYVDGKPMNIGLDLKFDGKQQKVLGYTRKMGNIWEYSEKAVRLISGYMKEFPELFKKLETFAKASKIDADDLEINIRSVKSYLKQFDLPRVSIHSDEMPLSEIEKLNLSLKFKSILLNSVPKDHIVGITDPNHSESLFLGDYCIYASDSGPVEAGSVGIVTGVDLDEANVLFDYVVMCKRQNLIRLKSLSALNVGKKSPPWKNPNQGQAIQKRTIKKTILKKESVVHLSKDAENSKNEAFISKKAINNSKEETPSKKPTNNAQKASNTLKKETKKPKKESEKSKKVTREAKTATIKTILKKPSNPKTGNDKPVLLPKKATEEVSNPNQNPLENTPAKKMNPPTKTTQMSVEEATEGLKALLNIGTSPKVVVRKDPQSGLSKTNSQEAAIKVESKPLKKGKIRTAFMEVPLQVQLKTKKSQ